MILYQIVCKEFYFSLGGHFVQRSETSWAILAQGIMSKILFKIILIYGQKFRRCCLKIVLFVAMMRALMAILLGRAGPFGQFWYRGSY